MRIGVLGGSFDPPHLGHLVLADQCAASLGLDRVLFIPAFRPPHKSPDALTPYALRAAMVESAIDGDSRFALLEIEKARGGVSYTVETVRELRRLHPHDELWLLLGQDSLEDLDHWKAPQEIAALVSFGVYRREGSAGRIPEFLAGRVHFVAGPRIDVSSSEIRERIRGGRSVRFLVAPGVLDLIGSERLYTAPRGA